MRARSVLFPQPLSPVMATVLASDTVRLTSVSTSRDSLPVTKRRASELTVTSGPSRRGTPRISSRRGTPRISSRRGTPRISSRRGTPRISSRRGTPRISSRRGTPRISLLITQHLGGPEARYRAGGRPRGAGAGEHREEADEERLLDKDMRGHRGEIEIGRREDREALRGSARREERGKDSAIRRTQLTSASTRENTPLTLTARASPTRARTPRRECR